MKILVNGGAGYIGSFMTRKLLDEGNSVVVADSLERGHKDAVDSRAKLSVGNLLDREFVKKIFAEDHFDGVIHFAGFISMKESMEQPGIYFTNNVDAVINVLEEMVKTNTHNFVFSSSAGIYGNPERVPIEEDDPKHPTNPYGESKLIVEQILRWYQDIHHINFAALRYFNACGASLNGDLGEAHFPESHIIPLAIFAALKNSEFTLFGSDWDTPDGTCVRDYIHVLDLVEAHLLAIKKLQKQGAGYWYNVGTGQGNSNKQIIDMVKKVSGTDFKVVMKERRPGDANTLVANPKKIKTELDFNPVYSDLETIVKTAWDWHSKNLK